MSSTVDEKEKDPTLMPVVRLSLGPAKIQKWTKLSAQIESLVERSFRSARWHAARRVMIADNPKPRTAEISRKAKTLFPSVAVRTMPEEWRIDFARALAKRLKVLADRRAPSQSRRPRMFDANGKIK